jgi:O-antigen/teichoic acid export membrane protein
MSDSPRPHAGSDAHARRSDFNARYARAAIHSSVGGAASQVLYGLTPVIIARYLGPRDYGVYSIVMSLVAIVTGLLSLGQNSMLHKLLPEYSVKDREMGGAILANTTLLTVSLLIAVSATLVGISGWLATNVYRDSSLTNVFRWAAAATMALALFNLASSAVAGLQDFKTYNRGLLLRSIALIALMWAGVQVSGLSGALAGQVLASLLGLALLMVYGWPLALRRFPGFIRLSGSGVLWKVMAGFTLPTLLMTLLNLPGFWWISTMVARHTGFVEAGHFGVGYAIAQLIFLLPQTLYTPAMTFMSEAHAGAEREGFGRLVGTNLRWIWALTLPLALGGSLASPLIINVLFGSEYKAAIPAAFVMSLAALLMVNTGLLNTAIIAAGHAWQGCVLTLLWAAVFFAAGCFCIPRWGAMGGAVAFTLSQGFYFVGNCLYSRRALRVRSDGLGRLALLTTFGAAAAIFVTFNLQGPAFYFASIFLLLGVLAAEWSWIGVETERQQLRQATAGMGLTLRSSE